MVNVSIIIPCRNEEKFIGKCLDSIIAQDYPNDKLEVLVVDGKSGDRTRDIVEDYTKCFSFVKLVDNLKKVAPIAFNIGIKRAKGKIIVIMSAHAVYPPSYISTCLKYLDKTSADVVGGPVITMPGADSLFAKGIALATSHPFGVGNSMFRISTKEGYVDTVPFGAYKREVFEKIGLFNEQLVRNQDNELNNRITNSGRKIYLTPKLTSYYYNQSTLSGLLKQALKTGMWNVVTIKINPAAFRWRHFIPFLFITALMVSVFLTLVHPSMQPIFFVLVGLYVCAALLSSIQIGIREGMNFILILPVLFFLYHVCYGIGTWAGLLRMVFTSWQGGSNNGKTKEGIPA
ncbi:MAG: glycosyltransferase family 2 protein [Bacteroidota bacterium]|jgi:cellulose synthase/poly-beta-1,6-N-acetylglucosamine synthase-like glycosyltransferase